MQGTGGFGRCNIATGSVPLPPFLLLLAPIRTAQRQFLFLINPLRRLFFFSAFLTLPCQSRRRSLPLLAIVLFSAPKYHQLHLFRPPSSKARNDVASTTQDGSSADLSHPLSSATHAVCCVVELAGRPERIAIPHLGNPKTASSANRGSGVVDLDRHFFCFEARRERARDPLLSNPLSRFLSNRAVHRHHKKSAKIPNRPRLTARFRMKHQHQ